MYNLNKTIMRKRFTLALLSLLLVPLAMMAQTVTVRSDNGNTLPAVKGEGANDAFYPMGGFALWKHNQLNLTMSTADSDGAAMTNSGLFENAANNIFKAGGTSTSLILGRGRTMDCYMALALPKGYRFTSYTIVFRRNVDLGAGSAGNASFGEVAFDNQGKPIWNTWFDNDTHKTGLKYSTSAGRQTIKRTYDEDYDDMGNILYFKLINDQSVTGGDTRAYITLETIRLEFTAEADYTPITPAGTFLNRTAVDIPFPTSSVDLGSIEERAYAGGNRISYTFENVKDLMANLTLFEAESVAPGTNYDGSTGKMVQYNDGGSISSEGDYFKVGKGSTEQVYYLETPTYVQLNDYDKTKNPVGYRITGAEIFYTYGKARAAHTETTTKEVIVEQKTYPTFTISGTVTNMYEATYDWWGYVDGVTPVDDKTYYLTSSAEISEESSNAAIWFRDDDGYIRLANNASKYLKTQTVDYTNNRLALVGKDDSPAKYNINESTGYISAQQNANLNLVIIPSRESYRGRNYNTGAQYFQMSTSSTYNKATRTLTGNEKTINIYETQTETLNFPAFTPQTFTLKLYDREGGMDASKGYKEITVTSTTPDGSLKIEHMNNDAVKIGIVGVGLIEGRLTMQALDPYIDQMTVVCEDEQKPQIKLEQNFTADDFGVSEENGGVFHFYLPEECVGDNIKLYFKDLYSHYADESYTKEKDGFNGNASNNSRFNFVKSEHYNAFGTTTNNIYNDFNEAANPQKERLKVNYLGKVPFKFNNSAEVGESGGTLIEYPFTLEKYGDDNDDNFEQTIVQATDGTVERVRYVFTTDETAYNISPATATQHRTYAFYRMEIHIESATYNPEIAFKPIYSKDKKTVYGDRQQDNFFGVEVTATDDDGHAGFASTTQVSQMIKAAIDAAYEGQDEDYVDPAVPNNPDKILYIDFSKLAGVYQTGDNQQLAATNAANCIIFVPKGAGGNRENVAQKIGEYEDGTPFFKAMRDVVLADKQPFYSPYDIQIDANQMVTYKREITVPKNGRVASASIIMPFAITIDKEGKHTNADETDWAFSIHEMQEKNCLGGDAEEGSPTYAYFPALEGAKKSVANYPYVVKVNTENLPEDEKLSFVCTQKGATIKATTGMSDDYTFAGSDSKGTDTKDGDKELNFTSHGSYSGKLLPYDGYYYYFASNTFVRSNEYKYKTDIRVAPFRAYYSTTGGASARTLSQFDIVFGEGMGNTPNGIETIANDLQGIDVNAPVYDLQGRKLANSLIGTTLKRGIYVINGVKFTVK